MIGYKFRLKEGSESILGWEVIEILDKELFSKTEADTPNGQKAYFYEYMLICRVLISEDEWTVVNISQDELLDEIKEGFYYLDGKPK